MNRCVFPGIVGLVLVGGGLVHGEATTAPPTADMVTEEPAIHSPKTEHEISVGGSRVRYHAWFDELMLNDGDHASRASISATTYLRDGTRDAGKRPVLFAFNGGPGASSSPLHLNALGPKVTEQHGEERRLVDNESSLIDVADLVFIDPVGTGFSRERPGGAGGRYFESHADARAALALMRQWLHENGREQSPIYIAGESYGGTRIAYMMPELKELRVAGLILISPGLDLSGSSGSEAGNDLPYILELPSMAAAAWVHQKVDPAGRTLESFFGEAERFAETDFALGLIQGSTLSAEERHRLAIREASFIGLPAAFIEEHGLRIDSQLFLETLMGKDKIVGRLDTRIVADVPKAPANPDRPAAANDPALHLGASNVIKSSLAKNYFENDLKVKTARDYLALSLDVNFRWNWSELLYDKDPKDPSFYINPTGNIAAAMHAQPAMRLLLIGGYYDMAVPLLAPRYALAHTDIPTGRMLMKAMAGPHSTFEGAENRRAGTSTLRAFMRGDAHE
jgi:carboxypeptidase C (cathepsin A)